MMHKLRELLDDNKSLDWCEDCIGDKREHCVKNMKPGDIVLCENLRFYVEEETNDPMFGQELAKGVDIYVNEAFSASHRAHASLLGIKAFVRVILLCYCTILKRECLWKGGRSGLLMCC